MLQGRAHLSVSSCDPHLQLSSGRRVTLMPQVPSEGALQKPWQTCLTTWLVPRAHWHLLPRNCCGCSEPPLPPATTIIPTIVTRLPHSLYLSSFSFPALLLQSISHQTQFSDLSFVYFYPSISTYCHCLCPGSSFPTRKNCSRLYLQHFVFSS